MSGKPKSSLQTNTQSLVLTALITAVLCTLGPLIIPLPFSPIPLSLCTFGIYIAVYILGIKKSFLSCLLYLILGTTGLPVFSGFTGGPGTLIGPTGGYLIGYLFIVLIGGFFINQFNAKTITAFFGLLLGTLACYFIGSLWLSLQTDIGIANAFMIGALPFLPADLCKIAAAVTLGRRIQKPLCNVFRNR